MAEGRREGGRRVGGRGQRRQKGGQRQVSVGRGGLRVDGRPSWAPEGGRAHAPRGCVLPVHRRDVPAAPATARDLPGRHGLCREGRMRVQTS